MKLLLYCTKAKPYLYVNRCVLSQGQWYSGFGDPLDKLNGKIVAECDYEIEEFDYMKAECLTHKYLDLLNKSCLTDKEMYDYLLGKNGYAIHIKNLHIFDDPKDLSDYYKPFTTHTLVGINKAPQNMMYAYEYEERNNEDYYKRNILISIHPEYLYKILNGEKTIEVRKKVLKEML